MIKQEVIEQVRTGTDIVDLVGAYLPLKKVGQNHRGLCPFHSERSPSFYVNPARQTYHCFGCGVGGSAINFVMAMEKLEFPEAVKFLAKRLGITVETEQGPGRNQALYDACEQATGFYEAQLAKSEPARAYIERRGLGAETVRRFRLGFAPGGNMLRGQLQKRRWSEEALVRSGLLVKRDEGLTDCFYGRLMFPIFSLSGKVIAFGGRVLDDSEPKYLNSPETAIFRKGDNLYGMFQAKAYVREDVPILVEGNFDMLSLVDKGINRVVAGLGTALTPAQAQLLRRYNNRAILCYDGDAAGRKACRRAVEVLLAAGVDPQVAVLPGGQDPDSYVMKHGKDGFLALAGATVDFVDSVLGARNLSSVAEQRAVLGELTGLLRLIADGATRELYANRISDRFRVDKRALLESTEQRPGSVGRKATPGEERLVGMVVQHRELAQLARDLKLSEALEDESLRPVTRLAEEHCEHADFGPGVLMDLIEDETTRRRVAEWTFLDASMPSDKEFQQVCARMRRVRAAWLQRLADAASLRGDSEQADVLNEERSRLLGSALAERSDRQHEE